MSDQTPPPDQPTPPPAEGAGEGSEHEAAAPPPPVEPEGHEAVPPQPVEPEGHEAAPPPPAKSRKGLLVGLVAGLVVLLLVAGGLTAFFLTRGPDKHAITVTSSAGGMKRDKAKETEFKTGLTATEKQFSTAFKVTSIKMGIYDQTKDSRGPKGQLLFVGFKFKTPSDKHPASFIKELRTIATANKLKVTTIKTGDAGGKAVCLGTPKEAAQKTASCFWVTRDSGGALLPNVQGYESAQMGKILTAVRADVEKKV